MPTPSSPPPSSFLAKLWADLNSRVFVAWRSTLVGFMVAAGVEALNFAAGYFGAQPQPWAHVVAALAATLGAAMKANAGTPPPRGFARYRTLAILALGAAGLLSLTLGTGGCATLKGASATTTVTTAAGQSYTLAVASTGGCVSSAAGVWLALPNTPFECDKVCIDVQPGAVTPGATCRLAGRPDTQFTVLVPVPVK